MKNIIIKAKYKLNDFENLPVHIIDFSSNVRGASQVNAIFIRLDSNSLDSALVSSGAFRDAKIIDIEEAKKEQNRNSVKRNGRERR